MNLWGPVLLVALLSDAQAGILRTSTIEEEGGRGTASQTSLDKKKSERLDSHNSALSTEEVEDVPSSIMNTNDTGSQGGGVKLIDSSLLKPKEPALPWWESWWNWIVN